MEIPKMDDRGRTVLLYLDEHDGSILSEITEGTELLKKDVAVGIGQLEIFGMIRLNWERRKDRRWEGRYYLAGEGTRDYIKALKVQSSASEATDPSSSRSPKE